MEKLLNFCLLVINILLILVIIAIASFTLFQLNGSGDLSLSSFLINFSFIGLLPLGVLVILRIFLKILKKGFEVNQTGEVSVQTLEINAEKKTKAAITTNLLLLLLLPGVAILSMFGTDSFVQSTIVTTMYSFGYATTLIGGILLVMSIVVAKVLLLKHKIALANRLLLVPRHIIAIGVLFMFLALMLP